MSELTLKQQATESETTIHHATDESKPQAKSVPLWAVGLLGLGPAVALCWARFGYGLLLPSMQQALNWSYAQAGALNTANALGYLAGALFASYVSRRIGLRSSFRWGIVSIIVSLAGCALISAFWGLIVLRALAGIGGAITYISGAVLVSTNVETEQRMSLSLALYFAGVGLGIAISALVIPPLLSIGNASGWRWGWAMLAGLSVISFVLIQPAIKYFSSASKNEGQEKFNFFSLKKLVFTAISYSLFGLGYIGYMTFIVAYLYHQGITNTEIPAVWAVLGISIILASFVWGNIFHRLRGGQGLAAVLIILAIGVIIPLVGTNIGLAIASTLLFGGAFMAGPSAVTYLIQQIVSPKQWAGALSALTVCFGIGQMIGPTLFGAISDVFGGISTGLAVSAGILFVGSIVSLFQREDIFEEKGKNKVVQT